MKRVRNFLILKALTPSPDFGRRVSQAMLTSTDSKRIRGWHESWDEAVLCLSQASVREVAIVDDNGSRNVIALFSRRKLESSKRVTKPVMRWKTAPIKGIEELWCNLNNSDYGWGWLGGAKREVPFRLQYLERQAEENPHGIVSKTYAWFSEVRDIVLGPSKKIG